MKYSVETKRKSEYFKDMYDAHESIRQIMEKINSLYQSATNISPSTGSISKSQPNPQRLENTLIEIADLRTMAENLLRQRARFDLFLCSLSRPEERVICMRYEKNMSWKQISAELHISVSSVKRLFRQAAAKFNRFDPN